MSSGDYLSALGEVASRATFLGPVPPTPWDPALQRIVEQELVAVYEEEVRGQLLGAMV